MTAKMAAFFCLLSKFPLSSDHSRYQSALLAIACTFLAAATDKWSLDKPTDSSGRFRVCLLKEFHVAQASNLITT